MKHSIITMLAMTAAIPAMAQLDNTVEVTNEVKPVATEAKQVPVKSQKAETKVTHYTMQYAVQDQPLGTYVEEPLGDYETEAVKKGNKKGYMHLSGGVLGKLDGQVAYQFDLTNRDALIADFTLKGFNGKTRDNELLGVKDWKSRFYQNRSALKYNHRFQNGADLYVKGGFENRVYNYLANDAFSSFILDTDKQHDVLADGEIGITPYKYDKFTFGGKAGVKFFSQNYKTPFLKDKLGETLLELEGEGEYEIDERQGVGLGLGVVHSNYGNDELKGETRLFVTPNYTFKNEDMDLKLGLFVSTTGHVAPDAKFTYHIDKLSDVYVGARGYEQDNDLRRLSALHPYFMLAPELGEEKEMESEFHQVDAFVGYRFKNICGLSGDFNVGYDYSKESPAWGLLQYPDDGRLFYGNVLAKSHRFYVNADLTYAYEDIVKVVAHNQLNIQQVKDEEGEEWQYGTLSTPTFEMDWKVDAKLTHGLYAGVDWNFASYRTKTYGGIGEYKRPNTVNLGASLRYTLPVDLPLTVFVKGDNLLNQKYDRYFGYRNIGANFLAGFAMSF